MRLTYVLVGVVLCASAAAAPRAGKVIRIERRPSGITGMPRYCTVSTPDNVAYCMATKGPEVGDRITVIDSTRVIGTVRVSHVQGHLDACQQQTSWMTQGTLETGDLSNPQGGVLGVIDLPLDMRHAKLVSVDKSPTGHPWGTDTVFAIDNNSDGSVDYAFVAFSCDESGAQTHNPSNMCFEVWAAKSGRTLEKVRHERIRTCY